MNVEIVGIIIGIIGIVIAILYIPPIVRLRKNFVDRLTHWTPRKQARRGIIQTSFSGRPHEIAYKYHSHHIYVDSNGGGRNIFKSQVVNTSDHIVPNINYCIYAQMPTVKKESIAPWFEVGSRRLEAMIWEWDTKDCAGVVSLPLPKSIAPGDGLSFKWGYYMPELFRSGDEFYNFDFGAKHDLVDIEIAFSPEWTILYARWAITKSSIVPSPPTVKKRTISASLQFPDFKSREKLLLGLSKLGV